MIKLIKYGSAAQLISQFCKSQLKLEFSAFTDILRKGLITDGVNQ